MFTNIGPAEAITIIKTYLITNIGQFEEPLKGKMMEIILSVGADTLVKGTEYLYSALMKYDLPNRNEAVYAVGVGGLQIALVGLWGRGDHGWRISSWAHYELNGGPSEILAPEEDLEFFFA